MKDKLPIGFYLKKADNLLTEGINHIHKAFDITRTQWQILNSINGKTQISRQQVVEALLEFSGRENINDAISNLVDRELLDERESLALTEKGGEVFQICLGKQKAFRQKAMQNVTEQEYAQIIATLEKIIGNLQ